VNPSGHLPVTFYASEAQLPRPVRPGGHSEMDQFTLDYTEGAAVGYKWVDRNNLQPLFPFGHGLSYTSFDYGPINAAAAPNGGIHVQFTLHNSGSRAGMAVGQVYASPASGGWEAPKRLVGFAKAQLAPGASKIVDVDVDPRLLATFDEGGHAWRIAPGTYMVMLGASSRDLRTKTSVNLPGLNLPSNWRPGQQAAAPTAQPGERGR
jgi:beta-glucosidase